METPVQADTGAMPKWAENTPLEVETHYVLDMLVSDDQPSPQSIDLTRAEFIMLKAHLATLRGIAQPAAA